MTETEELQLLKQQLDVKNQQLELLKKESRSSRSTTSGRKRPAPVGWEVIIHALKGIDNKETVLSNLEYMKSPEEFFHYDFGAKRRFVQRIGLMDWEDAITDQIAKVCVLYVCVELFMHS